MHPPSRPLATLAATAAAVSLLAGCGTRTVEGQELEGKITTSLERQVGERPDAIECPNEVDAKKGTKARCIIKASDGSEIGLNVTMTDDEGAFDYEVDQQASKPPAK